MIPNGCAKFAQFAPLAAREGALKVQVDDEFLGISLPAYEALYFDEDFNSALGDALELGRQLIRLDRDAARVVRHVGYEPKRDPNSPAGQAFGSSRASFVEELDYDLHAHRGAWRTIPNVIADRVRNAGTIELTETPRGVRRVVHAEVRISLFGFGGLVERAVAAEIAKSYAKTTEFTLAWLARAR
jgi:hypothetical protein